MLLGYGAKNCWCFKEWLEISLRPNIRDNMEEGTGPQNAQSQPRPEVQTQPQAQPQAQVQFQPMAQPQAQSQPMAQPQAQFQPMAQPQAQFQPMAQPLAQLLMSFQGANASGKTCALRVLAFIADFVLNSHSYEPESPLPYSTFFGSEDSSEFFAEFTSSDGTEYRYEAVLHRGHVETERIIRISPAEEEVVLLREKSALAVNHLFTPRAVSVFRNNASVISTLHQQGVREISPITAFFSGVITNVKRPSLTSEPASTLSVVTAKYFNDRDAISFTADRLRKLGTGITEITFRPREPLLPESPAPKAYEAVCIHATAQGSSALTLDAESAGIRKLVADLYLVHQCLKLNFPGAFYMHPKFS